jgi:hypothetical protein
LSPTEFASLRQIANGLSKAVSREHIDTLLDMELVHFGLSGLAVSDRGRQRLEREDPEAWRGAPASNPFDRPPGK